MVVGAIDCPATKVALPCRSMEKPLAVDVKIRASPEAGTGLGNAALSSCGVWVSNPLSTPQAVKVEDKQMPKSNVVIYILFFFM